MAQAQAKENQSRFTITRTFDAPRDRVWNAWSDSKQLKQWFGPKGCTISYSSVDFRPGGASRYGMTYNGVTMWGKWSYKEIKAPEKLVAIVTFTDETGEKTIPHPGMPGWPKQILSTISFVAKGNKTEIIVEWQPYQPTDSERRVFDENHDSMQQGWSGSFDQLETFLAKHK